MKGYTPNWSVEVFANKEVKNTVPSTYVLMKKLLEHLWKKKHKQQINKDLG